jgi:enamine deaminase RidA (YjgF/YER057c/UK114 family)
VRRTVEAAGGTLNDVVKMTQYFRNLRDFPTYNRIRDLLRRPAREHGCSDFGIAADLGFAA